MREVTFLKRHLRHKFGIILKVEQEGARGGLEK